MIRKIAFIGITGMMGQPVARVLLRREFQLTALTRHPEKLKISDGLTIIRGDLRNQEDVEKTLDGNDAVYVSLSVEQAERPNDWHSETDGMAILLTAAKKSGIRRIILLSSLVQRYQGMNNFHWWVFVIKEQCIRMIRESGIPYTIFYPSTFMESFTGKYKLGRQILLAGKSRFPMYYIAGEDYGNQVAASLELLDQESKEFVVQGPEALTQEEAAKVFIKHYRKEALTIRTVPLGVLKFLSPLSAKINYGSHIVEALTLYPEEFESEETWRILGRPQITVKEFAERS